MSLKQIQDTEVTSMDLENIELSETQFPAVFVFH